MLRIRVSLPLKDLKQMKKNDKAPRITAWIVAGCIGLLAIIAIYVFFFTPKAAPTEKKQYDEIYYPTQNFDRGKINDVRGVILHHTALPTIQRSLEVLTLPVNKVGTHCLIDTDGTRYILCAPTVVTFHAGLSILNGRERCNEFTIGIEFQGNTVEKPLTDDQIQSAIDYLLPIIDQYQIPLDSIVTHEMVRANYMRQYPEKKCKDKCDITPPEYERVMKALRAAYQQHQEDRS